MLLPGGFTGPKEQGQGNHRLRQGDFIDLRRGVMKCPLGTGFLPVYGQPLLGRLL